MRTANAKIIPIASYLKNVLRFYFIVCNFKKFPGGMPHPLAIA